jgi:hypothetical protein
VQIAPIAIDALGVDLVGDLREKIRVPGSS